MNFTINPDSLYQVITLPKSLVATNAVLLVGDAGSGKTSRLATYWEANAQFGSAQRRFEFWSALEQVRTSVSKGSASENRSRLCRSSSLSSHLRRQPARDLEGEPVLAQPLRRARSRGSKSQTMMENSNSSTRTLLG
ncbi:hypothetical protein PCANC_11184 [Puccinia coronata f. sp. avenae]|uniref:Uncharacterized protein n=1 Tax=Puccinia coronata f. sp. avenae TaxID=200324 RepID=A0A2N5URB5_9BASI|nr:hypothetical protein PCANC_11184 [Puccinia coronata f. sp. avenae]